MFFICRLIFHILTTDNFVYSVSGKIWIYPVPLSKDPFVYQLQRFSTLESQSRSSKIFAILWAKPDTELPVMLEMDDVIQFYDSKAPQRPVPGPRNVKFVFVSQHYEHYSGQSRDALCGTGLQLNRFAEGKFARYYISSFSPTYLANPFRVDISWLRRSTNCISH